MIVWLIFTILLSHFHAHRAHFFSVSVCILYTNSRHSNGLIDSVNRASIHLCICNIRNINFEFMIDMKQMNGQSEQESKKIYEKQNDMNVGHGQNQTKIKEI